MYDFLTQLDKLQQLTNATVHMHIVSPIDEKQMTEFLHMLDNSFRSYYRLHKTNTAKMILLEGAASYPLEDFLATGYMYKPDPRIVELKKPIDSSHKNPANFGKFKYVEEWTNQINNNPNKEILMQIYCGNGRNDLAAMDFINRQKNGVVICPSNTRHEAKAKTQFVSEKADLPGITDGLSKIAAEIEKRIHPEQPQSRSENSQNIL